MSGQTPPGRLPPSPAPAVRDYPPMQDERWFNPIPQPQADRPGRSGAGLQFLFTVGAIIVALLACVGMITLIQRASVLLCH